MSDRIENRRGMRIALPSPDGSFHHLFFFDPENDESLVEFLGSLLEIYGHEGEEIAMEILGVEAFTRAILGGLVKEGEIVRGADGRYRLAKYAGLPH